MNITENNYLLCGRMRNRLSYNDAHFTRVEALRWRPVLSPDEIAKLEHMCYNAFAERDLISFPYLHFLNFNKL